MREYLTLVEGSAFSTWVRESESLWAYPTILTAHTLGMGVLVGSIVVLNLRVLGRALTIPLGAMASVFRAFWLGACISLVTGMILFCADATTKGTSDVFFVKLAFIAMGLFVARMQSKEIRGAAATDATASRRAHRLALTSLVCWVAAIGAGRLMAYLAPAP